MDHPVWKIFVILTIIFIGVNLYFINKKLFFESATGKQAMTASNNQPTTQTPTTTCGPDCLEIIREATASLQLATTPIVAGFSRTAAPLPTPTTSQVRQFFVPLGTGSVSNDSWTDVPGAQATIDSNQYTSIKSVTFEAAVDVPGRNQGVWVRLYNDTDNYIVGGSELYFENGNSAALQSSGTISLGAGNKKYKVQLKTQLNFPANLNTARIHILTN